MTSNIDSILKHIANEYRGPGGAIAVIRDGELAGSYAYGYADLNERIPVTTTTQFPICSISKQMVCLVLADLAQRPTSDMIKRGGDVWEQMTEELKKVVPQLSGNKDGELKVENLYNMQSGIRDYWAMTTLWGSRPDDRFSVSLQAPQALARTHSFHFPPGTEYSYSNVNFHLLGKLLEKVSGNSLGQLLASRVFIPAGMKTAALCPNTAGLPLPIVGYEFDEDTGYIPAINRMEWEGDAGNVCSLEDMIAYEKWLQRSWTDPQSIYNTIAKPQTYNDGTPAAYGFGLAHEEIDGKHAMGHGGALRGFRLGRVHVPSERLSVVVMFNHESDAHGAVDTLVKKVLGIQGEIPLNVVASEQWAGEYLDYETGLITHVEPDTEVGKIKVKYGTRGEKVNLKDANNAASDSMTLSIDGDNLHVKRIKDNRTINARRVGRIESGKPKPVPSQEGFTGVYRSEESDSTFHCTGEGGILYGAFDGFMGKGPVWMMRYAGEDVWLLNTPRGLDAAPPGDWTCVFKRGSDGKVQRVTIGCWLARKVEFVRVS